jgi:choloylglycine hydrolase
MCTAISLISKNRNIFFGRTMDFSFELAPEVFIVPRNYEWFSIDKDNFIRNKYKFIATGQNIGDVVFADGVNEHGLAGAVLYFQGYANYESSDNNKPVSVATIDLVNFILGNCTNVIDVIKMVNNINIISVKDDITNSIAPLHWIFIDSNNNCITVEKTVNGLQIFNNEIGVLANSPNFEWQLTNLRNYINIKPSQDEEAIWGEISLKPFGQGAGNFGLPGDFTSPSRFTRTSFLKNFVPAPNTDEEAINLCFNIVKSVTIPKGVVLTSRNTYDYTQYTVFMNIKTGDYYFNTYSNNQITKVNINEVNSNNIYSLGKLKKKATFNRI